MLEIDVAGDQWAAGEVTMLRKYYQKYGAMWVGWGACLPGRSVQSIHAKARELGLLYGSARNEKKSHTMHEQSNQPKMSKSERDMPVFGLNQSCIRQKCNELVQHPTTDDEYLLQLKQLTLLTRDFYKGIDLNIDDKMKSKTLYMVREIAKRLDVDPRALTAAVFFDVLLEEKKHVTKRVSNRNYCARK